MPSEWPQAKPLPAAYELQSFRPALSGWMAYYYQALEGEAGRVIALPIAIWALVRYGAGKPEIRHFIVTDSGCCIDYLSIPEDFICILGPAIPDHKAVILHHLSARGLKAENEVFGGN